MVTTYSISNEIALFLSHNKEDDVMPQIEADLVDAFNEMQRLSAKIRELTKQKEQAKEKIESAFRKNAKSLRLDHYSILRTNVVVPEHLVKEYDYWKYRIEPVT